MNKILSISIAAYQVESTIEQCLDSFLTSKYLDELELLVINDGSKDRTAEIVKDYEKRYTKVIRLINKENGGHGSTINKSLELATGKFYKIIDGDDWVDARELDRLIEFLRETDAELVVNCYREVYPDYSRVIGHPDGYELCKVYEFSKGISLVNDCSIVMHAITVLAERLRAVELKIQEHCFYADTEFLFFVGLCAKTITFHDSCVYQYRLGVAGQSVSNIGIYSHVEDLIKIENRLIELYKLNYQEKMEDKRKEYLFSIIDTRCLMLFYWYIDLITKSDKDALFIKFIADLKMRHNDLLKSFHLSIFNRVLVLNPTLFIPIARYLKQSHIWSFLRKCKRLAINESKLF